MAFLGIEALNRKKGEKVSLKYFEAVKKRVYSRTPEKGEKRLS